MAAQPAESAVLAPPVQTAAFAQEQAAPVPAAATAQAHGTPAQGAAPQLAGPANRNIDEIVFGQDLAAGDTLREDRATLVQGLCHGQAEATTLVGQLLVFRAASAERMPQLLRDIGEAYCHWRPDTSHGEDRMRDALIAWLHSTCEAVGVSNKIELVRPGDRFESKRHNAKERGVEVATVRGWVVLRDNGKVYTKASVTVR